MKIYYVFLLTAGSAFLTAFSAKSQTLPLPGKPSSAIWQPLPAPGPVESAKLFITRQMTAPPANPFKIGRSGDFSPVRPLPAELPGLNYEDLRGKDGHLHAPLPPGVTGRMSSPGVDRIVSLRPDNMPCRMTDVARLERMPTRRMRNADQMNSRSAK